MNPEALKAALLLPVKRWGKAYPISHADSNSEQKKACEHIDANKNNDSNNSNNKTDDGDDDDSKYSRHPVPTDDTLADTVKVGEDHESVVTQHGFQEETPTTELEPTAAHDAADRGKKKRLAAPTAKDHVEGIFLHVSTGAGSFATEEAITFVVERLPIAPRNRPEAIDTVRVVLDCAGSLNVATMSGTVDLKRTVRISRHRFLFWKKYCFY